MQTECEDTYMKNLLILCLGVSILFAAYHLQAGQSPPYPQKVVLYSHGQPGMTWISRGPISRHGDYLEFTKSDGLNTKLLLGSANNVVISPIK